MNTANVLDIGPLRSLIAIADTGGFHRAAATLALTQSAVSQHVRRLEAVVGKRLLERDGRRTRFTAAGELLLAEGRQIVAAHDRALQRLAVAHTEQLVIGSTEHAADLILPPIISVLSGAFPDVQVTFRFDRSTALNKAIDLGTIDVAVYVTESSGRAGTPVGSLPLRWCAAPGWTPPRGGEPLPLIAIEAPCVIRNTALRILAESGIDAKVVGDAAYLSGTLNAARAGLGVTLLAFSGPPPEGLSEVGELPPAPPIPLATRMRVGAPAEITASVMDVLRQTLAPDESLPPVTTERGLAQVAAGLVS